MSTFPHDTRKSVPGRARVAGKNGGVLYPFEKGHGHAPGYNKPASLRATLALARKHSPEAMMTLIRNLRHEDGRISTMSASLILERALGKAKEMPEVSPQARIDLTRLTDQELQVLLGLVQSGRLQPVPHAAEDGDPPVIDGAAN